MSISQIFFELNKVLVAKCFTKYSIRLKKSDVFDF